MIYELHKFKLHFHFRANVLTEPDLRHQEKVG
jgi:hypothetical protein